MDICYIHNILYIKKNATNATNLMRQLLVVTLMGPEVVDEILHLVHAFRGNVVEGDGRGGTAVHALGETLG